MLPDGTDRTILMDQNANLPAIVPDVAAMARIKSEIDISDRSRLVIFGERAQRSVVEFCRSDPGADAKPRARKHR